MNILLVNDDGIEAEGIKVLAMELEKENKVIIVAPDDQRSACGHSITLGKPVTLKEFKIQDVKSKAYSLSGTPADCVRIGILEACKNFNVDVVMSGINRGVNLGRDILYSGTVSAAIEASMNELPAIAVSAHLKGEKINYKLAAKYAKKALKLVDKNVLLNLNVPCIEENKVKGIKVCKSGGRLYEDNYKEIDRQEGQVTFITNGLLNEVHDEDTDVKYLKEGYVTITPLQYDLTNYSILKEAE